MTGCSVGGGFRAEQKTVVVRKIGLGAGFFLGAERGMNDGSPSGGGDLDRG